MGNSESSQREKDIKLFVAASKGNRDEVRRLVLKEGANINYIHYGDERARAACPRTPLYVAIENKHIAVAKDVIDMGANIELGCQSCRTTALHSAVAGNHVELVGILIARGANLEAVKKCGETPLCTAAGFGYVECTRLLLNAGADVNFIIPGHFKNSVLWCACWDGHVEVIKLLIAAKANLDYRNTAPCSAVEISAQRGHFGATKILLEAGANPTGALISCAYESADIAIISLLLDYKADPYEIWEGNTVYRLAKQKGLTKMVKFLESRGIQR